VPLTWLSLKTRLVPRPLRTLQRGCPERSRSDGAPAVLAMAAGSNAGHPPSVHYFPFRLESSLATSATVIISIRGSIGDRTKPCLS
jgi:hypothetical protein